MRTYSLFIATLLLACQCLPAAAAEHVVNQKGKAFVQKKLVVKAGDSVRFVNDDPFAHNVFSLSDTKSFDLGSYGQGLGKTVVLDKAGTVEVECAVHPDMKMVIEVLK
ncbi:MAG: methylamine utilization protein [Burkholderiales bacterium]|nr:methylamine utilization protein [Burkholderiales bacterium]